MTTRLTSLAATAALVAAAVTITVAAPSAGAAVGAGQDRRLSTPTAWWVYANQSAAQITATLNTNRSRLTDLQVRYTGATPHFTVTEVANTGAYATAWRWYYGMSATALVTKAIDTSSRIVTMQCAVVSGVQRCAAIMVDNRGTDNRAWWTYVGSIATIKSHLTSTNRMVSLRRIQGTSSYVAVLMGNTGSDVTGWYWFYNTGASSIVKYGTDHHARIVDLDRNDDGTYNAVLYANPSGTPWYTYIGLSATSLLSKAAQLGQRLIELMPYVVNGRTYYAGVMVNNANALSSQLIATLGSTVPNGTWGFELKRVGGQVLAGLQTDTAFEPASTLKVLYHYRADLSEQQGAAADSDPVAYRYDPAHPSNKDICPDAFDNVASTTLANADALMMQNSDNRMTRGIVEKFGKSAMTAQAAALGMTHTVINHNIGCPTATTHNSTSLSDLAKLYSAVSQHTDLTGTWNTTFRQRMLNEANYPSAKTSLCTIVKQEASALHKSTSVANAFCANLHWIAKGGSYQYGNDATTSPVSWSNGSLTSLPVKSGGAITPVEYFYGDYFDEMSFANVTARTVFGTARSAAFAQAIRPQIRAALLTW